MTPLQPFARFCSRNYEHLIITLFAYILTQYAYIAFHRRLVL